MMDYSQFVVEDFVLDSDFRKWVLKPDAENNTFWQAWLARYPGKVGVLQEARSIILNIPPVNYGWSDEVENSLWQRILVDTSTEPDDISKESATRKENGTKVIPLNPDAVLGTASNLRKRRTWHLPMVWGVAASMLLILTAAIFSYYQFHSGSSSDLAATGFLVYEAPAGTKLTFRLSDGTEVFLKGNSRVIYPDNFSPHERRIEIEGEAFVEVAKDKARPFIVKTGPVITEALGTAFNVKSESTGIEIALVEGAVKVTSTQEGADDRNVILMPGERTSLAENGNLLITTFDIAEVTAWTNNILYFKGAAEQEIIRCLERWYGVQITCVGESSKRWNYSGRFHDKSLDFVLKSIGYTMDFTFVIEERKVVIEYR